MCHDNLDCLSNTKEKNPVSHIQNLRFWGWIFRTAKGLKTLLTAHLSFKVGKSVTGQMEADIPSWIRISLTV